MIKLVFKDHVDALENLTSKDTLRQEWGDMTQFTLDLSSFHCIFWFSNPSRPQQRDFPVRPLRYLNWARCGGGEGLMGPNMPGPVQPARASLACQG